MVFGAVKKTVGLVFTRAQKVLLPVKVLGKLIAPGLWEKRGAGKKNGSGAMSEQGFFTKVSCVNGFCVIAGVKYFCFIALFYKIVCCKKRQKRTSKKSQGLIVGTGKNAVYFVFLRLLL